ncbi:MAG: hypothetical protein L6Q54_04800 [Leptospiraceae bacterium]|nr:hypothetical protein [Leptospiraceae bacterium]MCK6380555.1 hypothetical protein [Leptospiraceae bacterium]NUM41806.1 hypothetical protein [Leptospiraceae bacterium]
MKFLVNLIICLSLFRCSTGFDSRKLVYNTSDSAYYLLEKDQFPNKKLVSGAFLHPFTMDESKIMDILGNLKVKKKNSFGETSIYIFSLGELKLISRDLSQLFGNLKEKEGAVFISKFDDIKSVLSTYKRTTGLIWVDSNGLNLLFGEIKSALPRDYKSFFDWTNIRPISMNVVADENEIEEDSFFQFNTVSGFKNRKWLIFKLDDLSKYKFQERLETRKLTRDEETSRLPKSEAIIKNSETK